MIDMLMFFGVIGCQSHLGGCVWRKPYFSPKVIGHGMFQCNMLSLKAEACVEHNIL